MSPLNRRTLLKNMGAAVLISTLSIAAGNKPKNNKPNFVWQKMI